MREADFYDEILADPDALANRPLETSPWLPLYRQAAGMVGGRSPVVDLGCGTGRFAQLLAERKCRSYRGVDFSARAIGECYRLKLSGYKFEVVDLREWQPGTVEALTAFVCLEVLEHIDDDRGVVAKVPPGHRFVGSVPNYDSEAHVRTFPSASSLWERYSHLLTFRRWSLIDAGPRGKAIHLFEGIRRKDSWE